VTRQRGIVVASHAMRAFVVVIAVSAAASLLVGFGGRSSGLSELRVCGSGSFDKSMGRCERSTLSNVRSSTLYCSVKTTGHAGDRFTGAFSYKGRVFPTQSGNVSGDGWIYTYLTIGGGSFPGGPWTCSVAAGSEKAKLNFTTAGPTALVSSAAACLTSRTVLAGVVRACMADDSTKRLPSTAAVTCSAIYSLASGHTAKAEVLYEGDSTGLKVVRKVPLPVSVFGVQVTKSGGLPAGDYACVFSLDGKKRVTKSFSIAG
jgi:hypothetical protein